MKNTTGKERATPTQLIKIAKARHVVGVTILDALRGHAHRMCRALATAKACRKSEVSKEKKLVCSSYWQISLQLIIQCSFEHIYKKFKLF